MFIFFSNSYFVKKHMLWFWDWKLFRKWINNSHALVYEDRTAFHFRAIKISERSFGTTYWEWGTGSSWFMMPLRNDWSLRPIMCVEALLSLRRQRLCHTPASCTARVLSAHICTIDKHFISPVQLPLAAPRLRPSVHTDTHDQLGVNVRWTIHATSIQWTNSN